MVVNFVRLLVYCLPDYLLIQIQLLKNLTRLIRLKLLWKGNIDMGQQFHNEIDSGGLVDA